MLLWKLSGLPALKRDQYIHALHIVTSYINKKSSRNIEQSNFEMFCTTRRSQDVWIVFLMLQLCQMSDETLIKSISHLRNSRLIRLQKTPLSNFLLSHFSVLFLLVVEKVPIFGLFVLCYCFLRDVTHFRTWMTIRTLPNSALGGEFEVLKVFFRLCVFLEHVCEFHLCVQRSCGREFVFLSWTFVQFCLKLED